VSAVALAKEKIINIRVDSELKREAKRMAEDDGRSLSNWILRLIQDEIKRNQKDTKNRKAR
jgi:predicted HicB family RNase H-like nuclease